MIEHLAEVKVRYAETDQMKFAHHSSYIVWFELARIEWMHAQGIDYAELEKQGVLLPVLEVNARYIKPARFDDTLYIKCSLAELPRKARFRFDYEVTRSDGTSLSNGFSVHSFMNSEDRAIRPPKYFLEKLKPYFD